jgi:DNA-binding NarL/FixJ family response regulator
MNKRATHIMVLDNDLVEDTVELDAAGAANLGTILIIEDDPRMQKVLRRIFIEEHYAVLVAGDGQSGLDLLRTARPLAVILDRSWWPGRRCLYERSLSIRKVERLTPHFAMVFKFCLNHQTSITLFTALDSTSVRYAHCTSGEMTVAPC